MAESRPGSDVRDASASGESNATAAVSHELLMSALSMRLAMWGSRKWWRKISMTVLCLFCLILLPVLMHTWDIGWKCAVLVLLISQCTICRMCWWYCHGV